MSDVIPEPITRYSMHTERTIVPLCHPLSGDVLHEVEIPTAVVTVQTEGFEAATMPVADAISLTIDDMRAMSMKRPLN